MSSLSILIIGNGKMGKEISQLATKSGHTISYIIDKETDWKLYDELNKPADVAIEFSMPEAAAANIMNCFKRNLPVVCGTTGWKDSFQQIADYCIAYGQSLIYASNFSPGMNIVFELNRQMAALISKINYYSAHIDETHHIHKLDSPSGTAISLADDIIRNTDCYHEWVNNVEAGKNQLPINSFRINEINGDHLIFWDSDYDTISLKHSAKNRQGFAIGALMAAAWIISHKGVFSMSDMLKQISSSE